jgi:general secretion pathway protein H
VCAISILAILAAIIMPALPAGTSQARLEAYAVEVASLLKADRNSALRSGTETRTEIDSEARWLRSGTTGRVVRIPDDVRLDAVLAARCKGRAAGRVISFFRSGMSCGGTIALTRLGSGFQVRVNWLTGGIEIVPIKVS